MIYSKFILLLLHKSLFDDRDVILGKKRINLQKKGGLRRYKLNDFILIEQNPLKKSEWAEMAREGEKISWLINTRKNKYLARVMGRKVTFL